MKNGNESQLIASLDRNNTKYELVDTQESNDGTVIIKIKKKYNNYSTEGYF